jgi:Fe2+ transport system protein FeoA
MKLKPESILIKRAGTIVSIQDNPLKLRMVSVGFHVGKKVELIRSSILEGTYYVKLEDQIFGLRKSEAEQILVV